MSARGGRSAGIRWWPSALGIVAGIAVGVGGGLAAVIMVCAAIYVLAAVTGRPNSAWIGFAASFPLIGVGILLHRPLLSLAAIGLVCIALIAIGGARGSWRVARNRRQLFGVVAFSAIAITAALLEAPLASGIVVVIGLLLHAAWDVWHHIRHSVVARPYAEFCAVLDLTLAILVGVALASA